MTQPNVSGSLVRLQPYNYVFLAAYASIGGIIANDHEALFLSELIFVIVCLSAWYSSINVFILWCH